MTTVIQIIDGAAEEIGVKTAETPLEAEDYQLFLNRLNDMGEEWADIGLTRSFVPVSNSTDTVEIDRNAVAAFKYNLAIRCAPSFQRVVSGDLRDLASSTLARLEASTDFIGDVEFPDTLPTGSGNDCGSIFREDRFFEENSRENF